MTLTEVSVEKRLGDCILPCLNELEELVKQMSKQEYNQAVGELSTEKEGLISQLS